MPALDAAAALRTEIHRCRRALSSRKRYPQRRRPTPARRRQQLRVAPGEVEVEVEVVVEVEVMVEVEVEVVEEEVEMVDTAAKQAVGETAGEGTAAAVVGLVAVLAVPP